MAGANAIVHNKGMPSHFNELLYRQVQIHESYDTDVLCIIEQQKCHPCHFQKAKFFLYVYRECFQ